MMMTQSEITVNNSKVLKYVHSYEEVVTLSAILNALKKHIKNYRVMPDRIEVSVDVYTDLPTKFYDVRAPLSIIGIPIVCNVDIVDKGERG